jgi:cell wall-associated NlpC family hydrolase
MGKLGVKHMNTLSDLHKLRVLLIAGVFLLLSACATTPYRSKRPNKTPQNISVGAGPNRAMAVYAMKFLGTPYKYGGSSPSEGFDCSGLVQYSAKKSLNLNLPRRSADQGGFGKSIALSNAKAGDLLFFNTDGQPYSHVGIYVGQTYFIHAPSTGKDVRIEDYTQTYWMQRFTSARRVQ